MPRGGRGRPRGSCRRPRETRVEAAGGRVGAGIFGQHEQQKRDRHKEIGIVLKPWKQGYQTTEHYNAQNHRNGNLNDVSVYGVAWKKRHPHKENYRAIKKNWAHLSGDKPGVHLPRCTSPGAPSPGAPPQVHPECAPPQVHLPRCTSLGAPPRVQLPGCTSPGVPPRVHLPGCTSLGASPQVHLPRRTSPRAPLQVHLPKFSSGSLLLLLPFPPSTILLPYR